MPFITTQDGWVVNLNQCVYIKPKNKDKDNKECPQIKMALTNGETLTCSFKTFKARKPFSCCSYCWYCIFYVC